VTRLREQVSEFHRAFGVAERSTPGIPDDDTVKLRLKLIGEEFCELLEACGYRGASIAIWSRLTDALSAAPKMDLEETVDALADLQYVIQGAYLSFGVDDEPITDEVQAANMRKLGPDGKPIYRESDRKLLKPKGWRGPDHRPLLLAQGWNPGGEP
jgi:predicted HAD superfamily Cof-like phosphohydrolase